jgi:hypothetical protein
VVNSGAEAVVVEASGWVDPVLTIDAEDGLEVGEVLVVEEEAEVAVEVVGAFWPEPMKQPIVYGYSMVAS